MSVKRMSKEERREALKNRVRDNAKNNGDSFGKRYLNFSNYEDVKFYKPTSKGRNVIDIIPYIITTKHHPQGMPVGAEDYILDIHVHKNVGPQRDSFVCLNKTYNKPCPICEEMDRLFKDGKEEEAKAIKAKRRSIYNVIDVNNPDDGIQIFDTVHFFFEKELTDELNSVAGADEVPVFADLEDGLSIKFRATDEKFEQASFFKFKSFDFVEREEPYSEDILDESYPLDALIVMPTYEEVQAAFYGQNIEEDEEDEDEPEAPPVKKSKSAPKKRKEVVENDDEDQEEEDEAPKKRTRRDRPARAEKKNKCPYGHVFGEDNLEHSECDECEVDHEDTFDACAKLYDSM